MNQQISQEHRAQKQAQVRVSLLIPAYNPRFFETSLRSATAQTYRDIEIVIADDSSGNDVRLIVERAKDARTRYIRNPVRRGFHRNFEMLLAEAQGEFVKFLNDDDVLHPDCVEQMVEAFDTLGARIALVTSRRHLIDEQGTVLPDTGPTRPIHGTNCFLDGRRLGNELLLKSENVIGEPSATLFRRGDVDTSKIFSIAGREYTCLADLALWLRLLAKGALAYIARPLSYIRVHSGRLQHSPAIAVRCFTERVYLPQDARSLGFLERPDDYAACLARGVEIVRHQLARADLTSSDRETLEDALRSAPPTSLSDLRQ